MWSYTLFPKICNMSLTAGLAICLVLAVRILLREVPKIFSYMLWLAVLFRLLCPVSFSMPVSFLELMKIQTSVTGRIEYIPEDIVFKETPEVQLPAAALSESINERLKEGEEQLVADPLEAPMAIATFIWLTGMAGMLIYSIFNWRHLKKTLMGAVPVQRNIYLSDYIPSPFVIGFFRPKIYLPSFLSEQEKGYILLHEQTTFAGATIS
ncbi:MAG: hypothetical protein J6B06_07775 [Lachnospiraceae bacterium]|nr:hypothetical protein [Lachnospiraceae bacterium]